MNKTTQTKPIAALSAVTLMTLALLAASPARADETPSTSPRFGIKLGFTSSTLGGRGAEMLGELFRSKGLAFGGVARVPIAQHVGVQAEVLYARRGTLVGTPGGDFDDAKAEIGLGYLQVPVLARLDIPLHIGNIRSYVYGGLNPAWLLSATYAFRTERNDIKDRVNGFDLALVAGVGANIGDAFSIEARYDRGLLAINLDSSAATAADAYNRALSVMVSYTFSIR